MECKQSKLIPAVKPNQIWSLVDAQICSLYFLSFGSKIERCDTHVFLSRPDGNFNSNTGNQGCQPDYVRIPLGSNNGLEDGSCTVTAGATPNVDMWDGI